ncbi:MAG TPA: nucleotidyl transferase AbiEii/AbiGii toxin family protein [Chthonomonadaceae bacterium]|nr:nucleotidyl transferase AbiEii/AbiGii toxin family protein [Chthonomonadaceae bacterium]
MRTGRPRNMSASIKDRLLPIARKRHEEFELVLTRYASERFLYRLSCSAYRTSFILKGANLFALWTGDLHRITRDLDLLGFGDPLIPRLIEIFTEVCQVTVEDDGLQFLKETIKGEAIREEAEYNGVRITMVAMLGTSRIPVQVDIGFGDDITPAPQEAELPVLLDLPPARLLVYPPETVIAEKCEAMVHLGLANSQLKDFYDLWYLSRHFDFEGQLLVKALKATFKRRGTILPAQIPSALTPDYYSSSDRQSQWRAFIRKSNLIVDRAPALEEIIGDLVPFLTPLLTAASRGAEFDLSWSPQEKSWQPIS